MGMTHEALLLKADEIIKGRAPTHGDFIQGLDNTGKGWAFILSEHLGIEVKPLPAHVVAAMMTVMKCGRAVRNAKFHEDDYVDAIVYLCGGHQSHYVSPNQERVDRGESV